SNSPLMPTLPSPMVPICMALPLFINIFKIVLLYIILRRIVIPDHTKDEVLMPAPTQPPAGGSCP
ncbi:MAG TPA: hypothetical protein VMS81_07670, partial [Methanomicrobiales archaeon]|nr:hypothetical protein [Methanomicrobiales archaeon]